MVKYFKCGFEREAVGEELDRITQQSKTNNFFPGIVGNNSLRCTKQTQEKICDL
jgi:hypothetical protein